MSRFPRKTIDLWVNNAKWHKGPWVRKFLNENRGLLIHYLPPYNPELNYQESLWRAMRYEQTTNVYFENLEQLEKSVFKRSQHWKPEKIVSLCQLT